MKLFNKVCLLSFVSDSNSMKIKLPEIPDIQMPSIPNINLPEIQVPEFEMPEMPKIEVSDDEIPKIREVSPCKDCLRFNGDGYLHLKSNTGNDSLIFQSMKAFTEGNLINPETGSIFVNMKLMAPIPSNGTIIHLGDTHQDKYFFGKCLLYLHSTKL